MGQRGYLVCTECGLSVLFMGDPKTTVWPEHRCGHDIRTFTQYVDKDPNLPRQV